MTEEGKKSDSNKLRTDLVPAETIEALAKVLGFGAVKYGDDNWKNGIEYYRIYGAILRHLLAWRKGELFDDESGLPHLYHALCELMFLTYYEDYPHAYRKFNTFADEWLKVQYESNF